MAGRPSRPLLVLWGQSMSGYVPPQAAAGLVRGHLLRRYPVSGATAAVAPGSWSEAQVAAHVTSTEWLPARTPAETVLSANDASPFHSVPTLSPEDVRWCTRHLLCTSCTRLSAGNDALAAVLANLRDVHHVAAEQHRRLAGAASLQTGRPVSCVVAELAEAVTYLRWSLESHTPGCAMCVAPLPLPAAAHARDDPRTEPPSSTQRHVSALLTSGDGPSQRGLHDSAAAAHDAALRRRFQREVAHLHCGTPRLSLRVEQPPSRRAVCVPLLTVATSTGDSIAAALKSAAIAWACCCRSLGTGGATAQQRCVYAEDVLWRPAPGTALVATWWAALLHDRQRSNAAACADGTCVTLRPASTSSPSTACSHALTPHGTSSDARFHVLVTGGDTVDHFLRPWHAGVEDAVVASRDVSAAPCAPSGDGDAESAAAEPVADVSTHAASTQAVLLCYGCPAAQVAHVRSTVERSVCDNTAAASTDVQPRSEAALTGALRRDTACTVVELRTEATLIAVVRESLQPRDVAGAAAHPSLSHAFSLTFSVRGPPIAVSSAEERHCLPDVVWAPTLSEVATHLFEHSVLESHSRCTAMRQRGGEASLHAPAQETTSGGVGWCTISFVPQQHAASLLRSLAQDHVGHLQHACHSFDSSCRRGPVPSPSHMHAAQEVLRRATRGEAEGKGGSGAATPQGRARTVRWRHVCGGFASPLTATAGSSSPYMVPCVLFTNLAEVAAAAHADGGDGHEGSASPIHCATAPHTRHSASPVVVSSTASATLAARHGTDETSTPPPASVGVPARVARAVAAVEHSVSELCALGDTAMLGYRGAVVANHLFVCSVPETWLDDVARAVPLRTQHHCL